MDRKYEKSQKITLGNTKQLVEYGKKQYILHKRAYPISCILLWILNNCFIYFYFREMERSHDDGNPKLCNEWIIIN